MSDVAQGLDTLVQALPRVLRPAQAVGWRTRMRIRIGEVIAQDLVVEAPVARVEPPGEAPPDTTLDLEPSHAQAVLTGTLAPLAALQQGVLRIDNLGDLFQFGGAFDLAALAEAAAGPAPEPAPAVDLPVGKRYRDGHVLVTPDDIALYSAATNDPSPVYFGAGAIAPPMMHARLLRDLLFGLMEDPELGLDMLHLLHGEHDLRIHRHPRPWDVVTRRATLDHIEQKDKGVLVEGTLWGFIDGQPAVEARTAFFVRGQRLAPVGTGHRSRPRPAPLPDRAPDVQRSFPVDADQSHRYAEASLDRNPVHIDPEVARAAGFTDVILHGLCTMALSGAALLKAVAFGDARVLRRLAVRWTRPVQNGTTLTLRAWRDEPGHYRFEVVDAEGHAVIRNGLAELDESE
jgi:acyl dehydratase